MQLQASDARDGVYVATGYGLKVRVSRGHLVVEDGVGADRRVARFNRATSGLRRLIVIGRTGFITLESLRWMRDANTAFVQLDIDGAVVAFSSITSADQVRLRRAQACARETGSDLVVARSLLSEKIARQIDVVGECEAMPGVEPELASALAALPDAQSIDDAILIEASAASAYWKAWAMEPVRFGARGVSVPDHWHAFGQRRSTLSRRSRSAVNPANAILNYLYALLEAEASLACQRIGLDPGIGFIHADRNGRDSLAVDVMEPCRPLVDAYLLTLLRQRTFDARADFVETRQGQCRLLPPLTRSLGAASLIWHAYLGPIVEGVAHVLVTGSDAEAHMRTPITNRNQTATIRERTGGLRRDRSTLPKLPATCRRCGGGLPNRQRRVCDECKRASVMDVGPQGRKAAQAALSRLRNERRDPAHGGAAARARGSKNARHQDEVKAWNATNGAPDPHAFETEIAVGLRGLRNRDLMEATQLSEHYCSLIRLGKRVPHPRHWDALRALVQS